MVVALGKWQSTNCTRSGLPGQSLRIWDLSLPDEERDTPVSNACFPNEVVLVTGPFQPQGTGSEKSWSIQLMTNRPEERWHTCLGCALEGETAPQLLKRLLKQAEKKRAQRKTPEQLESRYGLKVMD